MANGFPAAPPPKKLRDRLTREEVAGHEIVTVRPPAESSALSGALVYFHGGAFVSGIAKQHWELISYLAEATQRTVFVPRYGLAPHYKASDALAFLDALYDQLAANGPLHILGDSAGGNLALLLAQAKAGDPAVAGLTLIAPWLDLSISNPEIDAVEPHDPWLTRAGLHPIARYWAGDYDRQDPAVSPLFGSFDQLPPTAVFVGTRDICWPDCRLLRDNAPSAITLHEQHGSPHVHPLLPTPEGRRAKYVIAREVNASLGQ